MKNKKDSQERRHYLPIYMSIGLSIGLAIGASIGNIPVGMTIGLGIGMGVGAILDVKARKESDAQSQADDKKEE